MLGSRRSQRGRLSKCPASSMARSRRSVKRSLEPGRRGSGGGTRGGDGHVPGDRPRPPRRRRPSAQRDPHTTRDNREGVPVELHLLPRFSTELVSRHGSKEACGGRWTLALPGETVEGRTRCRRLTDTRSIRTVPRPELANERLIRRPIGDYQREASGSKVARRRQPQGSIAVAATRLRALDANGGHPHRNPWRAQPTAPERDSPKSPLRRGTEVFGNPRPANALRDSPISDVSGRRALLRRRPEPARQAAPLALRHRTLRK